MNQASGSLDPSDSTDVAFELLGLSPDADRAAVRSAFRSRVAEVHPDVAGAAGAEPTLHLLDAYRTALHHASREPHHQDDARHRGSAEASAPDEPEVDAGPIGRSVWLVDDDTIALACSREEAFARVLEVGHSIGSITYLDREGELLEVLLRTTLGDTISLVISFQGRNNWVEAFLTSEVLDRAKHELPTTSQLTELYAHQLSVRW